MTRSRRRTGAAAVELALLLPFLALLFVAVTDFARVFHATQVLQSAAEAGALAASGTTWTPGYPGTAATAAQTAACAEGASMNPAVRAADVGVVFAGGMATVTVGCDFPMATGMLVGGSVRLERSAVVAVAPRPGD